MSAVALSEPPLRVLRSTRPLPSSSSSSSAPAPATAPGAVGAPAAADDEGTLMAAIAAGDEGAFGRLFDRVAPAVLGVCLRVIRDRAMAEEVTQEVLLEAWEKADRFDGARGSLSGWMTTLAHRRAVDRVRSEQSSRDRDERVSRRDHQPEVDVVAEEVTTRLEHWQVRQALAQLSERQREAIELAYFSGYTYRDVAEVLGIPEGTAKSRLRDGLLRLRELLADLA